MKLYYRPDIDGLRAIAVLGVLMFHAEVPALTGGFAGVDIFFVISGYLITSILIIEMDARGKIDFINFWARRTRRLIPSALLVIIVTLIVSHFVLSKPEFHYVVADSVWAATYLINWTKLIAAVEYFDEGGQMEPFLHYWSLAVEEQFYIYITLVILLSLAIKRLFANTASWPMVRTVIILITISGLLSFAANLYYVADSQPIAFFGTPSRIWQLTLGAAIGLIERSGLIPSSRIRLTTAWAGLTAMLFANFIFNSELSYPGVHALLPSFGAGLFIFSGINRLNASLPLPLRIIAMRLPIAIGKISYSLYLWHWPVYVLWKNYWKSWAAIDIAITLVIIFTLSIFSYYIIENPVRSSRWLVARPGYSLIGATTLSVLVVTSSLLIGQVATHQNIIMLTSGKTFQPEKIRNDLPLSYITKPACHLSQRAVDYPPCIFGSPNSKKQIFLFGDSHAAQWFPALKVIAKNYQLKLYSRTKSACASIDIRQWHKKWKREYTECLKWRKKVLEEILHQKPDLVILANSARHSPLSKDKSLLKGSARLEALKLAEHNTITQILSSGATIYYIKETPWHAFDPLNCLISNPGKSKVCQTHITSALAKRSPWSITSYSKRSKVHVIDLVDKFCWENHCFIANDDFIFMRDRHHITRTYSEFLAKEFAKKIILEHF